MTRQKCYNLSIFTRIFCKTFRKIFAARIIAPLFTSLVCKVVKVDGATNGRGSITGMVFGAKGQSTERQFLELFSSSRRGGRPQEYIDRTRIIILWNSPYSFSRPPFLNLNSITPDLYSLFPMNIQTGRETHPRPPPSLPPSLSGIQRIKLIYRAKQPSPPSSLPSRLLAPIISPTSHQLVRRS